jgi:hypothetical protein
MSNCISTFSEGQIDSGKRNIRSRQWAVAGVVSLLMVQMAPAVLVEFTTGEGYTSGSLNGQPSGNSSWATSSGNASFTVNPAGGGSVAVDTAASNSNTAVYQSPIDFTTGVAYTSSVEFSFTQSVVNTGTSTVLFSNAYSSNPSSTTLGSSAISLGRVTGVDGYRFATFASASVNIAGTALGINSAGSDTTSDIIRMTLTLQQGATATTWIGTATLYNVTTSTVLATRTSNAVDLSGVFTDTSLYGTMAVGGTASTSGASNLTVLAYSSPVAVPEPATWALLIGGALFLVLRRARQRA